MGGGRLSLLDQDRVHKAYRIALGRDPEDADRARGQREGYDPGGAIMIHGLPNGFGWVGS